MSQPTSETCDRHVGTAIALLGSWGQLDMVAAVLDTPVEQIADAVDRLAAAGALTYTDAWQIAPAASRAALASTMPDAQRAVLRGRIARELERRGADDDEICDHLLAAPGCGDLTSVAALRRCARAAMTTGDGDRAAAVLRRALLEPPGAAEVVAVLLELADALIAGGAPEEALSIARRALARTEAVHDRVDAVIGVHRALLRLGAGEEAVDLLCREGDAVSDGHPELALRLELELAEASPLERVALETFVSRFQSRKVDPSVPGGDRYRLIGACQLAMGGRASADDAVALVTPSLARRPVDADWNAVANTLWLLIRADRHTLAGELLRRFRAASPAPRELAMLGAFEGLSALHQGSISRAVEILIGARQTAERHADELGQMAATAFLAHAFLERDADAQLEELLAGEPDPGGRGNAWAAILLIARGRRRLARGHAHQALDDLMAVDRIKDELGMTNPAGYHQAEYATEALLTLGDLTAARALAERNFARAASWGAPETLARAHRARALCQPPRDAVSSLHSAIALVAPSDCELVHVQLRLDLGEALIRANARRDADRELRRAADHARRLGAQRIADHASATLRALGRRPRRAYFHGVEALTPAELRVARLAAAGRSNRQVAAALHLSVRTVENQLRRAYQKLDTNRTGLSAALNPSGAASDDERLGGLPV